MTSVTERNPVSARKIWSEAIECDYVGGGAAVAGISLPAAGPPHPPQDKVFRMHSYGVSVDYVKHFGIFDPLPALSPFKTDLYCEIHATSLTLSSSLSDDDIMHGSPLC